MAVGNPYPGDGRGIRKGQSLPAGNTVGSGAPGGVPTVEHAPVSACDYEKTVAGVVVGVRLHSVEDMEAMGYQAVGHSGVCGASLVLGDDSLEALSREYPGEGLAGTDLAIARAVFGGSSDPSPARHEGVSPGIASADTFVLASLPEDAPAGLVEDVLAERRSV